MSQVTCMKRGNTWQYRFEGAKIGGKRKRFTKSGFATKKEALEAGNKALTEYNNSGLAFVPSEMSFSDFLDFWVEEYCKVNLKDTTTEGYEKRIRNHIKPALGTYKLCSLNPAVLQTLINDKFNAGYGKNSLTALKTIMSSCLSYAVEPLGFLRTNPMKSVKIPSPRAKPETPTRKKEREAVSPEAWNAIITRFPFGHSCHIPLLLAYRCGLRLGEAFALDWEKDIDLEQKTLSVNGQIQWLDGYWEFTNPKYDSFRTILLDDYMVSTLKRAKDLQDRAKIFYDEFYVHLYVNEKKQLVTEKTEGCTEVHMLNVREDGSYIQPRVMQHCGRVVHYELGYMKFDYHSLRHTHATMLIENGAPLKDVQHRLGHKSVQVTLDIYSHVTQKMQIQTVDILNCTPIDGSAAEQTETMGTPSYLNIGVEHQEGIEISSAKWHKNSTWGTRLYPR